MKKFSKFIKESLPIRIKTSKEPMFVMVVGEDKHCITEWYEKNLSGMLYFSTTEQGGDSKMVLNGLTEEHVDLGTSFRTGNTVIHLAHGANDKDIEQSMRVAKEQGLTTALVSFGDTKVDQNLVDIKYKI